MRSGCYLGRRHEGDGRLSDVKAVFSAGPVFGALARVPTPSDADAIVAEADARYESPGARSEFSRSRGVDYERFKRFALEVRMLERAFVSESSPGAGAPPTREAALLPRPERTRPPTAELCLEAIEAEDDSGDVVRVRVRVVGLTEQAHESLELAGRCPLCRRRGHALRMCPHVPSELRPFA